MFCSKQTSEEGDLLFLVRIKLEQVEERASWILRANLPAGWLGIESVEIWQRQGGDEEMWKLFGLIKNFLAKIRVAQLGSFSSGAKMAMETLIKHVFTILATNASFLRVIAKL